jgi:hypothetical protein
MVAFAKGLLAAFGVIVLLAALLLVAPYEDRYAGARVASRFVWILVGAITFAWACRIDELLRLLREIRDAAKPPERQRGQALDFGVGCGVLPFWYELFSFLAAILKDGRR